MLKGVSTLISPDLLKTLHEMGHGDELMLADAHFPGHTLGRRILRADGVTIPPLLDAILRLVELDGPENAVAMMQPDRGDELDPELQAEYLRAIQIHAPYIVAPTRMERSAFYERARACFAVLLAGELRPYGNIILRKGVTLTS